VGELLTDLAQWVADVAHSFVYAGAFALIVLGDLRLPSHTVGLAQRGFAGHLRLPSFRHANASRLTAFTASTPFNPLI
jgi:hypothetical protein